MAVRSSTLLLRLTTSGLKVRTRSHSLQVVALQVVGNCGGTTVAAREEEVSQRVGPPGDVGRTDRASRVDAGSGLGELVEIAPVNKAAVWYGTAGNGTAWGHASEWGGDVVVIRRSVRG